MGKKQQEFEIDPEVEYDDDILEGRASADSFDSEEQAMQDEKPVDEQKASRKTGKVQDRDSTKNKLKLGQFHRNASFKPKKRKQTAKKQIRDIERLLDREGLPEEIRTKKKAELKELKKQAKKQREAQLFESKYKKIKFTEKKKVIRQMEQTKKAFVQEGIDEDQRSNLQSKLKTLQDQLTYINHFPATQKYISLFPSKDDEVSQKRRTEAMTKVLQTAAIKQQIRERDLLEEVAGTDNQKPGQEKSQDDRVFGKDKDVAQLDPFFVDAEATEKGEELQNTQSAVEKRAVMRDGRVPKMQKNVIKAQQKEIERQARREGWLQMQEQKKQEHLRQERAKKPLKINSTSYGTGVAKQKAIGAPTVASNTLNVKF